MKKKYTALVIILFVMSSGLCFSDSQFKRKDSEIKKKHEERFKNTDVRLNSYSKRIIKTHKAIINRKTKTSVWIRNKNKKNIHFISNNKYDAVVIPAEIDRFSFSKKEALVLTRYITSFLEENGVKVVPVDFMVNGLSAEYNNIYELAEKLNVKYVIKSRSGFYNDALQTFFNVEIVNVNNKKSKTFKFLGESPSDVFPPSEIFLQHKTDLKKGFSDFTKRKIKYKKYIYSEDDVYSEFPKLNNKTNFSSTSNINNLLLMNLFGVLSSRISTEKTVLLFSKSLAAMNKHSESSKYKAHLTARSYFYLGARPVAVKMLKNRKEPENKALLAYINGNLSKLKKIIPLVKNTFLRDLLKLEYFMLSENYQLLDKKEFKSFLDKHKDWQFFIYRSVYNYDTWKQDFSVYLKQYLDDSYPKKEFSLNINFLKTMGDRLDANVYIDKQSHEHIKKIMLTSNIITINQNDRFTQLDFLSFLNKINFQNVIRRIKFYFSVQGDYSKAYNLVNKYRPTFNDEIRIENAATSILFRKLKDAGVLGETELYSIRDKFINAYAWADKDVFGGGSISYLSSLRNNKVFYKDRNIMDAHSLSKAVDNSYMFWPEKISNKKNDDSILRFLSHIHIPSGKIKSFIDHKQYSKETIKKVISELENRFEGSSTRNSLLALLYERAGNTRLQIQKLKESIESGTKNSSIYLKLGGFYINNNDYDAAYKLFISYPFMDEKSGSSVGISNTAYQFGNLFFWSGEIDKAIKFYEISVKTNSGSSNYYRSIGKLATINKKFKDAAYAYYMDSRRYNSRYSYSEYLLNVFLNNSSSWNVFDGVVNKVSSAAIWDAAIVGHNFESASLSKVIKWGEIYNYKNFNESKTNMFNRLIVTLFLLGREQSESDYDLIEKYILKTKVHIGFELKHKNIISNKRFDLAVASQAADNKALNKKMNNIKSHEPEKRKKIINEYRLAQNKRIDKKMSKHHALFKNRYSKFMNKSGMNNKYWFFLSAYNQLLFKKYDAAYNTLKAGTSYFGFLGNEYVDTLLPYYVYATYKQTKKPTKDTEIMLESHRKQIFDIDGADKYRKTDEGRSNLFNYNLSIGIQHALKGEHQKAANKIRLIVNKGLPTISLRPIPAWYQLIETCEWLYKDTNNKIYYDFVLEFSRKYSKIQPYHGWSYAFIAKYSNNEKEKIRAIALAQYLTPLSRRIKDLPESLKNKGKIWLKTHNPFADEPTQKKKIAI